MVRRRARIIAGIAAAAAIGVLAGPASADPPPPRPQLCPQPGELPAPGDSGRCLVDVSEAGLQLARR